MRVLKPIPGYVHRFPLCWINVSEKAARTRPTSNNRVTARSTSKHSSLARGVSPNLRTLSSVRER